jgi:hypothetical protein
MPLVRKTKTITLMYLGSLPISGSTLQRLDRQPTALFIVVFYTYFGTLCNHKRAFGYQYSSYYYFRYFFAPLYTRGYWRSAFFLAQPMEQAS